MTHKRFTRRQTKQAFPTFLMAASAQTVSSMSRKTGAGSSGEVDWLHSVGIEKNQRQ